MKSKTAMQELLEALSFLGYRPIPNGLKRTYLEKEKQQIIDVWENGQSMCGEFNTPTIITGKQYYNETYGNEKE